MIIFKSVLLVTLFSGIICPPVQENAAESENEIEEELGLEYERYVKEVVQALESDPDFRKKLESANPEDIKKGKIADELDFVHHSVRSKLDELKRQELERLRKLAIAEYEEKEGVQRRGGRLKIPGHVDHKNLQTFEKEDLRKLIIQTTRDLDEADKKRRDEFKQYEMEKEFEHKMKLEKLDEEHKKQEEKEWEEQQKKHKEHPKLHHPGSKQQLEEVWEKEDHMEANDWDPKTFFKLHDIDGNGVWDPVEVKALFRNELNKVYDPNAPEDDMRERVEEMERMREHVVRETDKNRDGLISFEEFLEESQKTEFNEDPGWDTIDQGPVYNQEEYHQYEQRRMAEIQRMVEQGLLPPQPHLNLMPPHPMMPPPQYGVPHPNAIPQGAYHPNAIPQYGVPQYGVPQYGVPHNETHYAVPQYAPQPGQVPQYAVPQPGQVPQYAVPQPGQVPQYAVPQQVPQYIPPPGQLPPYVQHNSTHYVIPAAYVPQVPQYGNQLPQQAAKITPEEGEKLKAGLVQQYQAGQPNIHAAPEQQPVVAAANAAVPIAAQQPNAQPVPVSYQQGAAQQQVQQPAAPQPQVVKH